MSRILTADTRAARRAFSLIELLVVITIITIVIAITVPTIGAARDLARGTATKSQIQSLTAAVSSFQTDNDRIPGYFNAAQMSDNTDGFTSMQNLILDLAGGTVSDDQGSAQNLPEVGPNNATQVFVNPALIGLDGANSKSYLQAGAVEFQSVEGKANVGNPDNLLIPEIVDSWGMPILAWVENEFAPEMADLDDPQLVNFATENEDAGLARFYWDQNLPVLEATALGERGEDQTESALVSRLSNGLAALTPEEKSETLAALLGSPASPLVAGGGEVATAIVRDFVPSSSKGGVLFQSAGRDRVFLSTQDKGYRTLAGQFTYAKYFSPAGNGTLGQNPWPNADNESGQRNIVELFNDIVTASPR